MSDKAMLVTLRQTVERAKTEYDFYAACNTMGLTAEERADLDVKFRLAQKRYYEAYNQYDLAVDRAVTAGAQP